MAYTYYYQDGMWWRNDPKYPGESVGMPPGWSPPAAKVPKTKKKVKRDIGRAGVEVRSVTAPLAGGIITSRRRVPKFSSNASGTFVSNTEVFVDFNASALGAFSVTNTPMLATQPSWLSGVADLYSKYRWRKLRFVYMPFCPTSTQGQAGISISYDRLDTNPTTIVAMQQAYKALTFPAYAGYEGAMALATFKTVAGMVVMDVDVSRFDKPWYPVISTATFGGLATNIQNAYCPATLYTASVNGPAAATFFGSCFIQYEIEFIEPVNPTVNV